MRGKLQRFGQRLLRSARSFYADNFLDLSATVAFYSLLSLGPLLFLIGTTLTGVFHRETAARQALRQLAAFLPPEGARVLAEVPIRPEAGEGLAWIALLALVWVASSALTSLEFAINVAFGTTPRRRTWLSRVKAFAILGTGWLALAGSLFLTSLVLPRLRAASDRLGLDLSAAGLARAGTTLLLLGVTWGILVLFYKLLPRCRVGWGPAMMGALVALILWEASRHLFGWILGRSPGFGLLTGAVAGIVAFLLWIYTAVAVVLLGAEFAGQLNGTRPSVRDGVSESA